jgi:hypothetical protein
MCKFSKQEDISINPTWMYSVYTVLGTCRELRNDFRADLISASQATEEEIRDGAVRRGCRVDRTGRVAKDRCVAIEKNESLCD